MTKVLLFIGSLTSGGAERVTVALSQYLAGRGDAVTVVTMDTERRDFFPLGTGVKRICLGLAGENWAIRKVTRNIERIIALRAKIKKEEAQVAVGMMWSGAIYTILACLGLNVRVIAAERNYPGHKSINTWWVVLRKLSYRFADGHVAQTQEAAEWLKRYTSARNVHVIPNAVTWPLPNCEPEVAPESLLPEHRKIILAAGSKPYQKGFDLLLQAFDQVIDKNNSWYLVIIGLDRPADYELLRPGRHKKHNDPTPSYDSDRRVCFPGRVGNMGDWYRRADIFVLSSRYEGFPNVLLEAMASGCASVSFDCDAGPRDVVDHEKNGLLVPAGNIEALTRSMQRLIDNQDFRRNLGAEATKVRLKFSEELVYQRWRHLIDDLAR